MDGKSSLMETLEVCRVIAEENPCHMGDSMLGFLAEGLRALLCREYSGGLNQRALGKYLGVDARTIQRWAHKYEDFPKGRHDGNKEVRYDTMEVILWIRRTEKGKRNAL